MDAAEITRLAALEDRHWWYAARRTLLRDLLRRVPPRGFALDVGAAAGGNTRVLRALGWDALAVEESAAGAALAARRGIPVVRADAHALPFADAAARLGVAFDVLEHLEDDAVALAELHRVLAPGAPLLVAVPADPGLWSAHDVAVGHRRRYTRAGLVGVVAAAGFAVEDVRSWNVLLKPVVRLRRRSATGSDLGTVPAPLNATLRALMRAEQWLPGVRSGAGVSLVLTARR